MNSLLTNQSSSCEFNTKYEFIDLNSLSIKQKNSKYEISVKDKKNKIIFFTPYPNFTDNLRYISKGSYGKIYILETKQKNKNYGLIFKIPHNIDMIDDDLDGLMLLQEHGVDCGIVNARSISLLPFQNITAMSVMSGDLNALKGKISLQQLPSIMYSCLYCLECLTSKGLGYLDIKLGNFLFHCSNNEDFKIVLGDIGSVGKMGEKQISTYVPYEQHETPRTQLIITEEAIIYLLGAMFLSIMDEREWKNSISTTFYIRDDNYNQDNIKSEINRFLFNKDFNKITVKDKTLDLYFYEILNLDPTKRPSLEKLLTIFKPPMKTEV